MAQVDITTELSEQKRSIPVLPLRDVVVYPHMVIPLFVGRDKSIQALEAAMDEEKEILLVAQKGHTESVQGRSGDVPWRTAFPLWSGRRA